MNHDLPLKMSMDASAGIAIASRKGLGRVKHISTVFFWCQDLVQSGRLRLYKRHTSDMLADILTKPVPASVLKKQMHCMGFTDASGRHSLAFDV